jgi:hypothetical protein
LDSQQTRGDWIISADANDNLDTRQVVRQLADDLGWLERHSRQHPEQAARAGQLRLAAALVRNCIGPFLDDQPSTPLHVAVVGGAGAGKSTVVNLLLGVPAAEANPQAGFTRHPIAYTSAQGALRWPAHVGFLGPLERAAETAAASVDRDVYQVRRIAPDPAGAQLLKEFVVWDCPDMTTWASANYVSRLLEITALADVLVYVASDERYNDEVPTELLRHLIDTGKPVVVCLMKMREADTAALVQHFRSEVLARIARDTVACLAVPYLEPGRLADPAGGAARYRVPLVNQVSVLGEPPERARRHVVQAATNYLASHVNDLLEVARRDVSALESWRSLVRRGQLEMDNRYRREYLSTERFAGFDAALVRLLDLLELPGVGKVVSTTLWVVRTPYRLVRGWLSKAIKRPDAPGLPEASVLEAAFDAWIDSLHKEAARQAGSHPLWAHIQGGFAGALPRAARERFAQAIGDFQSSVAGEVERTARAIYEELEKNPVVLNTLRSGNFALDVAAIVGALAIGHIGLHDIVLVPLLASIKQQIVELLGSQYVDSQREQIRLRQQLLLSQHVTGPLSQWLADWPVSGGSSFERLQVSLRRIPAEIRRLHAAVMDSMAAKKMKAAS